MHCSLVVCVVVFWLLESARPAHYVVVYSAIGCWLGQARATCMQCQAPFVELQLKYNAEKYTTQKRVQHNYICSNIDLHSHWCNMFYLQLALIGDSTWESSWLPRLSKVISTDLNVSADFSWLLFSKTLPSCHLSYV